MNNLAELGEFGRSLHFRLIFHPEQSFAMLEVCLIGQEYFIGALIGIWRRFILVRNLRRATSESLIALQG